MEVLQSSQPWCSSLPPCLIWSNIFFHANFRLLWSSDWDWSNKSHIEDRFLTGYSIYIYICTDIVPNVQIVHGPNTLHNVDRHVWPLSWIYESNLPNPDCPHSSWRVHMITWCNQHSDWIILCCTVLLPDCSIYIKFVILYYFSITFHRTISLLSFLPLKENAFSCWHYVFCWHRMIPPFYSFRNSKFIYKSTFFFFIFALPYPSDCQM